MSEFDPFWPSSCAGSKQDHAYLIGLGNNIGLYLRHLLYKLVIISGSIQFVATNFDKRDGFTLKNPTKLLAVQGVAQKNLRLRVGN